MDSAQVPAGSVVVGVDGSTGSDAAVCWAADQAALEHRRLTVVHAVTPVGFHGLSMHPHEGAVYTSFLADLHDAGKAVLKGASALALARHPELDVRRLLSDVDPRTTLLHLGEGAAMMVVGSRGRGPISTMLLGSVSVTVAKQAVCPVVVHRPTADDQPRHGVLVGVDGSDHSVPAIEFAYQMASWRAFPLTVLHSYWDARPETDTPTADQESEQALVAEAVAGMTEKFPDVAVSVRLIRGLADTQLIGASRDYDLTVIGHHPVPRVSDLIYGSLTLAVVEHASGPVAVVPSLAGPAAAPC